jgi:hypothetical protein
MGMIVIGVASQLTRRILYTNALDTTKISGAPAGKPSSEAGYKKAVATQANANDLYHVDAHAYNAEALRVPSDGYSDSGVLFVPLNNIIMEDVNREVRVEFIDVKCKVIKENTIIETPVVSRDGTVKEFINAKDHDITLSGSVIANSAHNFPADDMKALIRLLSQKANFRVESAFLNFFEIRQMVFKQGTFDQNAAQYFNAMPFSLIFKSDMDYDFLVNE